MTAEKWNETILNDGTFTLFGGHEHKVTLKYVLGATPETCTMKIMAQNLYFMH